MKLSQLINHERSPEDTEEHPSVDFLHAREQGKPARSAWSTSKSLRGDVRIVIVDDNADAATLLNEVMQFYGYKTAVAHSGQDALALIARERPYVAIVDLGMPGMSGIQVAQSLRRGGTSSDQLVLIALTGWGDADIRARASAAGFDFHFLKPADPSALSAVIDEEAFRKRVSAAG